jgi:hypothetical protein
VIRLVLVFIRVYLCSSVVPFSFFLAFLAFLACLAVQLFFLVLLASWRFNYWSSFVSFVSFVVQLTNHPEVSAKSRTILRRLSREKGFPAL